MPIDLFTPDLKINYPFYLPYISSNFNFKNLVFNQIDSFLSLPTDSEYYFLIAKGVGLAAASFLFALTLVKTSFTHVLTAEHLWGNSTGFVEP